MIFTMLKVPVSSSQAVVGAVMGIGLLHGANTVSFKTLRFIFIGWLLTPVCGATAAFLFFKILV